MIETKDFWEKHNISTRFLIVIFGISFLIVVIGGIKGISISVLIINMVWYTSIIAFGVLTLGVNGLEKLLNGIATIKFGKKDD